MTSAGLGEEEGPQGHLSPHPDVSEGIAEQRQSGETLTCRGSFRAEISPFHTCWAPAVPSTVP